MWKHLRAWAFRPCEVVCSFSFAVPPPTMVFCFAALFGMDLGDAEKPYLAQGPSGTGRWRT